MTAPDSVPGGSLEYAALAARLDGKEYLWVLIGDLREGTDGRVVSPAQYVEDHALRYLYSKHITELGKFLATAYLDASPRGANSPRFDTLADLELELSALRLQVRELNARVAIQDDDS